MKKHLTNFGIVIFSIAAGLYVLRWDFQSLSFIRPTFFAWLYGGDWDAHFLAWHFLRHEAWSFPLGRISKLAYPYGTSVAFTDPLPIFAYLFRIFNAWLPADFQYAGIWFALCFILQALFGAWLVELLTSNLLLIGTGSLLFTVSPVLFHRVRHISLCAHWLILAFLWLYFQKRARTWVDYVFLYVLNFIAWWSHPYLGGIITALSICALARWTCSGDRLDWRRFGAQFTSLALFNAFHLFVGGYFNAPLGDIQTDTWGAEALHLYGLFQSDGYTNFKIFPWHYPNPDGSYMYLGIGMMMMAVLGIVLHFRSDPNENRSAGANGHRADFSHTTVKFLLITCGLLTIYALSNRIYWDQQMILKYPLPNIVLRNFGIFRICGRFFWPCYYLIFFFSIRMVLKHFRPVVAGCIMMSVLSLQLAEFKDKMCIYTMGEAFPLYTPLKDKFWDHVDRFKGIMIIPNTYDVKTDADFFFFAYLAANHGMYTTFAHTARYSHAQVAYLTEAQNQIKTGTINPDILYIVPDIHVREWAPYFKKIAKCGRIDGYYVCSQRG
jgi:hypothetical protein